jgi:hypothetical protein
MENVWSIPQIPVATPVVLHSRDVTFAVLCQGPYEESVRYRDFMGWEMPWYSAKNSLDTLLVPRSGDFRHAHRPAKARAGDLGVGRRSLAARRINRARVWGHLL